MPPLSRTSGPASADPEPSSATPEPPSPNCFSLTKQKITNHEREKEKGDSKERTLSGLGGDSGDSVEAVARHENEDDDEEDDLRVVVLLRSLKVVRAWPLLENGIAVRELELRALALGL